MNSVVLNGIVYQCHISNDNCKYELISADGTVKSLTYPENHKHKIEDIVEIVDNDD